MSPVVLAAGLLVAAADPDAVFQSRVGDHALTEKLWVLEWGRVNLDDDAALERVAKLCHDPPSREVLYVFQDDTAPAGELWSWEVDEGGYEQATACPPRAPAQWLASGRALKHVQVAGAAVRSSRSSMAWGLTTDVGFRKGALAKVSEKVFGTPPEPGAPLRIHRLSALGKLHAQLELEGLIRQLVPGDGKGNLLAIDGLVALGGARPEVGDAVLRHVFTAPEAFFADAQVPQERWLPGTRANAATVLCKLHHVKARPVLKRLHDDPASPAHLKEALAYALKCLEGTR